MAEEKVVPTVSTELNPQQAINILVQAVNLGQKAGVYSLDDAALIKNAVDVFIKKDAPAGTGTPELTAVKDVTTSENTAQDISEVPSEVPATDTKG